MVEWNNYIMRKHGQSIRRRIEENHDGFVKGVAIVSAHKTKEELNKTDMMDYAEEELE